MSGVWWDPNADDGECYICGKEKSDWETTKHDKYCPECYNTLCEALTLVGRLHGSEADIWDALDDLWDHVFEKSRLSSEEKR